MRNRRKPQKTSAMIRGIPPEIRKEHLLHASLEHYLHINLLGEEI
jgi:hypothetical protein